MSRVSAEVVVSGRVQRVATPPTATVRDTVTKLCEENGLGDASQWGVRVGGAGGKFLDKLSEWRFVPAPPRNARFELVRQVLSANATVRVAVQLPSGQRVQVSVHPRTMLWTLLRVCEQQEGAMCVTRALAADGVHHATPVVQLNNREIGALEQLASTSLESEGIVAGSIVLRVTLRDTDRSLDEARAELDSLDARANESGDLANEAARQVQRIADAAEAQRQREAAEEQTRVEQIRAREAAEQREQQRAEAERARRAGEERERRARAEAAARARSEASAAAASASTAAAAAASAGPSQELLLAPAEPVVVRGAASDPDGWEAAIRRAQKAMQDVSSEPVVSGNYEELNRSLAQSQQALLALRSERAAGAASSSSAAPSGDADAAQPVERNMVVVRRPENLGIRIEDLPTDFYRLTAKDIAAMRKGREESEGSDGLAVLNDSDVLMTREMRDMREQRRLRVFDKYPTTTLRIVFPDKLMLQGTFSKTETLADVYSFVREHLDESARTRGFYVYLTPPVQKLPNDATTLLRARLVPRALLYLAFTNAPAGSTTGPFLRADLVESAREIVLVEDELSAVPPAVPGPDESASAASADVAVARTSTTASASHHHPAASDSAAAGPSRGGAARGAPKWLKM